MSGCVAARVARAEEEGQARRRACSSACVRTVWVDGEVSSESFLVRIRSFLRIERRKISDQRDAKHPSCGPRLIRHVVGNARIACMHASKLASITLPVADQR